MKQLVTLMKVYMCNTFRLNVIKNTNDSKQRRKLTMSLVGFIVIGVMLASSMFGYFYGMGQVFQSIGRPELVMAIACAVACAVSFITTVFHVSGTLISFSDYDAVMSLPLRQSVIVASRMLKLYGSNLFFLLFIMVPACLVYAQLVPLSASFFVVFILTLLFLPLLPTVIAAIIGLAISTFSVGFKRKNLANILLSMVFLVTVMALSFGSTSFMANIASIGETLAGVVTQIYPPAAWYGAALAGNWGSLLLFLAVSILPALAFVLLISKYYRPLHALLTRKKRIVISTESGPRRTPVKALYIKELKRYFASPIYVSNTAFGSVLMVIAAAALLIFGKTKLAAFLETPGLANILTVGLPFILGLFPCMSATTPCCISMEGNRLWQLKVLPLQPRQIFLSKLMVSLVIMLPVIPIAAVLCIIALRPAPLTAVMLFITPVSYALFMGVLGIQLNLALPKMEWKSETEVVKQSMPVLIAVLGGMALTVIPAIALAALPANVSVLAAPVWTALLLLVTLLLWRGLLKKGGARLMRL